MYTNECGVNDTVKLIKFADDYILPGLSGDKDDEVVCKPQTEYFAIWCYKNKLLLNADKTKNIVIDFWVKKEPVAR